MTHEDVIALIKAARDSGAVGLNLSGTGLTSIPAEVFELDSLQTLELTSNQITEVPPEIANLGGLKSLNLGDNKIAFVSEKLTELENLEFLNLGTNQLKTFPPNLRKLRNLQVLYLDNNPGKIPTDVGHLPQLVKLIASPQQLPRALRDRTGEELIEGLRSWAQSELLQSYEEAQAVVADLNRLRQSVTGPASEIQELRAYLAARSTEKATEKLVEALDESENLYAGSARQALLFTAITAFGLLVGLGFSGGWEPVGEPSTYLWQYLSHNGALIALATIVLIGVKVSLALAHNLASVRHKKTMLLTLEETVKGFGSQMEGQEIASLMREIVAHQPTGFVKGSGGEDHSINVGPVGVK